MEERGGVSPGSRSAARKEDLGCHRCRPYAFQTPAAVGKVRAPEEPADRGGPAPCPPYPGEPWCPSLLNARTAPPGWAPRARILFSHNCNHFHRELPPLPPRPPLSSALGPPSRDILQRTPPDPWLSCARQRSAATCALPWS